MTQNTTKKYDITNFKQQNISDKTFKLVSGSLWNPLNAAVNVLMEELNKEYHRTFEPSEMRISINCICKRNGLLKLLVYINDKDIRESISDIILLPLSLPAAAE